MSKKRIKVLRKLLKEKYSDECIGCKEKSQYIDRIVALEGSSASINAEVRDGNGAVRGNDEL